MKLTTRFFTRGLICLFICFFSITAIHGQNNNFLHKKDSLLKVIASTQGEERLKVYKALVEFDQSSQLSEEDVDLMLQYINDFIREARKQQNKEYESLACREELIYLWRHLKDDEFRRKANEYLPIFKKNGSYKAYYDTYVPVVQLLGRDGNNKRTIEGAKQIYAEAKQEDCLYGITQATLLIAQIYYMEGRYDEAEKYYQETMRNASKLIKEESDLANYNLMSKGYNGLANSLIDQKKLNELLALMPVWKKYTIDFEKAFGYPDPFLVLYYKTCALAEIAKEKYEEAELYCDSLQPIIVPIEQHLIWNIRASICEGRNEYDSAIGWIDKNIDWRTNLGFSNYYTIYLLKEKARLLSKMGRAEESYSVIIKAFERNDSIVQLENSAQLDEIRIQYEVDKHIAEKEHLHNYLFFALGGCILLAILLGIWMHYSRIVTKKNRGLYRQIKEQDRLKDELDIISKQYEQLIQSLPATGEHELNAADEIVNLQSNKQQRQLVSCMHEYLLKDRAFVNSDIDIDQIAPKLATNRTYLFDAIKAVTGKTPMEYVNCLRLEEAKRLLDHSDLTIETIIAECGFSSLRTFYRLFSNYYRITPSEYRKIATTS
ncbi:MAG: helix-turn-helix transcriptional regulator [Dysgonamonadaceae bacterium]|jgi:AraC-like DNA-binding protein|nr:helix-turn-helix transcriptional regulator [Dysgonamonadaceae bacterium]